jgi:hypothetical protein
MESEAYEIIDLSLCVPQLITFEPISIFYGIQ